MLNFSTLSVWLNVGIFALASAAVWLAGTRLSRFADAISRRTGIGQAALGVLLLGGITSLPEMAVAGSASLGGNAALAVNNLLGGFSMQVAILAAADFAIRRGALTSMVPDPVVLLQGTLGILMIAVLVAGIGVGDVAVAGAGAWTWLIFCLLAGGIAMITKSSAKPSWKVVGEPPQPKISDDDPMAERSGVYLATATAIAGFAIIVFGFVLSKSAEALAEQTGLGSSFFGTVFVAIATSLPEISTVFAAIALGRYVMAVSDIFGTNLFDIGVIILVDLFYPGGPVLNEVGDYSIVVAMLGIVMTAIYLVGFIERRDPVVGGIGFDSIAVAVTYLGGIVLLFGMR